MLLAIGYRLLSTYKIHRIVTIPSSFVNSASINCAVQFFSLSLQPILFLLTPYRGIWSYSKLLLSAKMGEKVSGIKVSRHNIKAFT